MVEPHWRVSGYDDRSHCFYDLGELFSSAVCQHSVPAAKLTQETGRHALRCVACLLIFGGDLAAKHGDPGGWAE